MPLTTESWRKEYRPEACEREKEHLDKMSEQDHQASNFSELSGNLSRDHLSNSGALSSKSDEWYD